MTSSSDPGTEPINMQPYNTPHGKSSRVLAAGHPLGYRFACFPLQHRSLTRLQSNNNVTNKIVLPMNRTIEFHLSIVLHIPLIDFYCQTICTRF